MESHFKGHELISLELFKKLPEEQVKRVLDQPMCDIEPHFLGFVDIYQSLSKIIPKHWTVIDFGCAYNPQCFYFTEHKKYIAVDNHPLERFKADNCEIYVSDIDEFIKKYEYPYKRTTHEVFAICSYVPANTKLLRETFKNLFVYYPHGGYNPVQGLGRKRFSSSRRS